MSRLEKLEWLLILIAVVSLFPVVLSYQAVWYRCYLVVVLAVMVAIFVIRIRRFRQALRDRDEQK